jgi:hypothetical protein
MNGISGVDLMVNKLEEAKASFIDKTASGVGSFDEYRRIVGVIQGLTFAIEVIRDVEKRLTEGDNE